MSQFAPLLALGAQEIITFVVFAIVMLASVISQFLAKKREQQAERRPERRPMEVNPMDEMQAGGQQPGPQQLSRPQAKKPVTMEDEIGDFLRRAARGGDQQPAKPRPAQQARPAQANLPPRPAQSRPKPARPRAPVPRRAQPPLTAEIVDPVRPPVGQGLGKQFTRGINTADITRHANELGNQTRKMFDHQVGNLQHLSDAAKTENEAASEPMLPLTSAAGLGALLSDADSLKQAIILNEILQRPAHHW